MVTHFCLSFPILFLVSSGLWSGVKDDKILSNKGQASLPWLGSLSLLTSCWHLRISLSLCLFINIIVTVQIKLVNRCTKSWNPINPGVGKSKEENFCKVMRKKGIMKKKGNKKTIDIGKLNRNKSTEKKIRQSGK